MICPQHGQFISSWRALRYAGMSCTKQTCPECDRIYGAVRRGHGTRGRTLAHELLSKRNMRIIGVEVRDGNRLKFSQRELYYARDRLVLECRNCVGSVVCRHHTIHSVSNLRHWLNDSTHLRCQGLLCRSERNGGARAVSLQSCISGAWKVSPCMDAANPQWTLHHPCGYTLTLSLKQLLKFKERTVDDSRCPVCTGSLPPPLGRTTSNMVLWLEQHIPHVILHDIKSTAGALKLTLKCRVHGGLWHAGARQLQLNRSSGCNECERELRHRKPDFWHASIETLAKYLKVRPREGWPATPDELRTWIGRGFPAKRCTFRELVRVRQLSAPADTPQFSGPARSLHFAIAGWMQADGFDPTKARRASAQRAGICILGCDLSLLLRIAKSVRCSPHIGIRLREKDKPSGAYTNITVTDESFVAWLRNDFGFGKRKSVEGYPRKACSQDQSTAYLAGLLGGDGYVQRTGRGPLISWLVVDNETLAHWVRDSINGLLSAKTVGPGGEGQRVSSRLNDAAKLRATPIRKKNGTISRRFTVSVSRRDACVYLAKDLLRYTDWLPERKVIVLRQLLDVSSDVRRVGPRLAFQGISGPKTETQGCFA